MTAICGRTIDEYTKMIVSFHGNFALCPTCSEAYPEDDGPVCLACGGTILYEKY